MNSTTRTPQLMLRRIKLHFSTLFLKYSENCLDSFDDFHKLYLDTPEYQWTLSKHMLRKLSCDEELYNYRRFIKENAYGMGEDEYMILWSLIVKSMPQHFSFCEIGVYKGQILALIKLLSNRENKTPVRYGISPMNGANTRYEKKDYKNEVETLHERFSLTKDYTIIKGYSTDPTIIESANERAPFDILYIDGSHETDDVRSDFNNYLSMVKKGGVLVVDDCNNNMPFVYGPPFFLGGRFWGIQNVSDVTDQCMKDNSEFEYIGSIIHNRIWKRIR